LYGGDGNDTLIGGHGADTINVQDGPHSPNDHDTIVYQDILDAGDTIQHFRGTGANHDTIEQTQLFDPLLGAGSTTARRVAAVHIASVSRGDIQVHIDTDRNTANGFEVTLASIQAPNFGASDLHVGNNAAVDQIIVGGT